MLEIAAEVGYSETAFVTEREPTASYDVRYFSPEAEVPFCGHATIATAVALAERDGDRRRWSSTRSRAGAGRARRGGGASWPR